MRSTNTRGILIALALTVINALAVTNAAAQVPSVKQPPNLRQQPPACGEVSETDLAALERVRQEALAATPAPQRSVERALTAVQRREATEISELVARGTAFGTIEPRWERLITDVHARSSRLDVNALVQSVLRQAYLETAADLAHYAEQVRQNQKRKKAIRDELAAAREHLSNYQRTGRWTAYEPPAGVPRISVRGVPQLSAHHTAEQLAEYIDDMERYLCGVGDDAQLANVDLQNKLQQQQQALQTMSNLSKMLHDTAMAVIRKIGDA